MPIQWIGSLLVLALAPLAWAAPPATSADAGCVATSNYNKSGHYTGCMVELGDEVQTQSPTQTSEKDCKTACAPTPQEPALKTTPSEMLLQGL